MNWDDIEIIEDWVEYRGNIYFASNGDTPDKVQLHYCATAAFNNNLIEKILTYKYCRRNLKPCHLTSYSKNPFFITKSKI